MPNTDDFLKYFYQETKDLCLHFLTLITAVLVLSVSFAEKVFHFQHATGVRRIVVILAWCFLVLAIILCGAGLVYNALAGGNAAEKGNKYMALANVAYWLIILSGVSFVVGLIHIILAAIISKSNTPG